MVAPHVNAQMGNRNEVSAFTTTESIDVAGVVIPPGTYVIRVVNQQSGETYNRNVIQVTSPDYTKVFVTAAANPRPAPAAKGGTSTIPLFEYYEAAKGQPRALRTWFPEGTQTGRDIVYPKRRAVELARIAKVPVPSIPDETKETELATIELTPVLPEPVAEPKPVVEAKPAAIVAEARPTLPQTASREPLLALLGFLSLGGALVLRFVARRVV